jgi:hypothetical protein
LQFRGLIGTNGCYNLPKLRGRRVHTLSARGLESQHFRHARNILFIKSVCCRYYGSIEDIVRYRKPLLLGRKSSARGRCKLRSEETLKDSPSRTVETSQLQIWGSIGNNGLCTLPELYCRRVHTLSARGREILNFPHYRNIQSMISSRY